jgi:hypothetical protein
MSTTLLRDSHSFDADIPTGVLLHRPSLAEHTTTPEVSGNERPTYLHPAVVTASVGGYAWMLLVFWVVFCGYGYMGFTMVIATLISAVMLALLIGCGAGGRNMAPWQRPWRSFREFLAGDVEIWGGRIPGRDAFIQLVGMSWCLAGLATAFGVIIALSRP